MDLQGERLIKAPRQAVWAALNDAAVLQACIPGCETIERLSATEMNVIARLSFGGEARRFIGKLLLSDIQLSDGYTISAEGQDESGSGFSGRMAVRLAVAGIGTRLGFTANATPRGALAAAAPGTLQTAATDYLESFFSHFATMVAPDAGNGMTAETQLAAQGMPPAPVLPLLETVPPVAVPDDPAAHVAVATPYHAPAHEDHDHDPSNPHYFGLPLGVILAGAVAGISVCITLVKFLG